MNFSALGGRTIVGIDVGGTFTDFVVWKNGRREVHKVLSTHPNPEIGVAEGLRYLGIIDDRSDNLQDNTSVGTVRDKAGNAVLTGAAIDAGLSEIMPAEAGAGVLSEIIPGDTGSYALQNEASTVTQPDTLPDMPDIIHGSTIATNALLERKGARVALLTTKGFTDLIDIGRQNRPHLYRLWDEKQPPLVPTDLRFGIDERIGAKGEIVTKLNMSGFEEIVGELHKLKVDAVAICFLFSFLNPEHEAKAEKALKDEGFFVSTSHKILPQYREYERLSTTVINAFVTPLVANYIARLENALGKVADRLKIMQSNGGLLSASATANQAVQTVLSGPAGGVVAALESARIAGHKKVISFDMGGTSTDVSLLDNSIGLTTEFDLDGLPVKIPMVDVHTVGAGGGSIAYVDDGGALQVGPESAGSNPGPVCYGRGNKPTITDANLVLGRMHPDNFLGGRQRLEIAKTEAAFDKLAGRLDMDRVVLADGIVRIAISNMHKAIRKISVERGFDPRDFALVAYGGAGPMHACELAEASMISTVIIPPVPGVFSALGMTLADVVKDYSCTMFVSDIKEFTTEKLDEIFVPLEMQAGQDLESEGFKAGTISLKRMLDLRYAGQSFELTIELDDGMICPDDLAGLFHKTHKDRYGFESNDERIEIIAFRIRAIGFRDKPGSANKQGSLPEPIIEAKHQPTPILITKTYFGEWVETQCYDRSDLTEDSIVVGPAIVFQLDTTTVIPPGWAGLVDMGGNIILTRAENDNRHL